jgi:hypothetical protein
MLLLHASKLAQQPVGSMQPTRLCFAAQLQLRHVNDPCVHLLFCKLQIAAANLSAKSFSNSCTKEPSARQGRNNVTILQPGPGQCGVDGFVDQGFYVLNQTAPVGTTFIGWKCYDITNGTVGQPSSTPFVSLSGNKSVSCVAEYNYTAPSPSPR